MYFHFVFKKMYNLKHMFYPHIYNTSVIHIFNLNIRKTLLLYVRLWLQ